MKQSLVDTPETVSRTAATAGAALSPKTQAVRRVLKRRTYSAQKELLRAGGGPAVGPGEEMDLAKAGFAAATRDLPHRGTMERAFGQPLHHVKAHIGPEAAEASAAMGAEAYALGPEVAFDRANPAPETVAHEVAHVVQQSRPGASGAAEKDLENEADRAAQSVVSGQKVTALKTDRPTLRKKEKLPQGEKGFQKMWEAHPHNNPEDDPDTSSAEINQSLGFPEDWNTCAIRLSIMLNQIGLKITPAKTAAAGIKRKPYFSKKTKQYYILAASEMWQYLQKNFRKADAIFPKAGRYRNAEEFQKAFDAEIRALVASKKGIVAFEKLLTGYSGSGHVDLFDGEKLSDAGVWYPCERLHLWYVVP